MCITRTEIVLSLHIPLYDRREFQGFSDVAYGLLAEKGLTVKAVRRCVGKATRDRTSLQKLATGWHFSDPPLALLNPPTHL
eukprot:jgi/Psemu1/51510/gm1.51510_g